MTKSLPVSLVPENPLLPETVTVTFVEKEQEYHHVIIEVGDLKHTLEFCEAFETFYFQVRALGHALIAQFEHTEVIHWTYDLEGSEMFIHFKHIEADCWEVTSGKVDGYHQCTPQPPVRVDLVDLGRALKLTEIGAVNEKTFLAKKGDTHVETFQQEQYN